MSIRSTRTFGLILVIIVMFSVLNSDSGLLDETLLLNMHKQELTSLQSVDSSVQDEQFCPTSTIEINTFVKVVKFSNQQYKQKSDLKQSFTLLGFLSVINIQGKFFSSSDEIAIDNLCLDELVTFYIHKSDGKKEII